MCTVHRRVRVFCCYSYIPFVENPNCPHTTVASAASHESSQTVPHCPPKHTSTRPSSEVGPPTSLTAPSVHSGGLTVRERERKKENGGRRVSRKRKIQILDVEREGETKKENKEEGSAH